GETKIGIVELAFVSRYERSSPQSAGASIAVPKLSEFWTTIVWLVVSAAACANAAACSASLRDGSQSCASALGSSERRSGQAELATTLVLAAAAAKASKAEAVTDMISVLERPSSWVKLTCLSQAARM